ncbi:MAG: DUF4130 domain-containing protein [Candidatus Aenigmatarchaeota archaeon]|nr:DUF4130 domain-containing protein [Nanoarchaeota archaeon]
MFEWAPRHKDFNREVFEQAMKQNPALLRNKATPEAKKIHSWNSQAGCYYHKTISFVRLETSRKGVLYAEMNPEHHIEDLVTRHFMRRFPTYIILIGSPRGTFVAMKNKYHGRTDLPLKQFLAQLETDLPDDKILSELQFDKKWWEVYYDSQEIRERENKRLFLQFMPKKYHYLTEYEKSVWNKKQKRLDSF